MKSLENLEPKDDRHITKEYPSFSNTVQNATNLLELTEAVFSRSSKDVFPFYLKAVDTYNQLPNLLITVDSWLESITLPCDESPFIIQLISDNFTGLKHIISKIVNNGEIGGLVRELEIINPVFQEVRTILGQTEKPSKEIREEIKNYLISLEVIVSLSPYLPTLKKRFKMYDNELYVAYDNVFVPRTNNDLEYFNNRLKRPIRKTQGRKESWFFIEHQGVSVALYHNLIKAPHNVGGTIISYYTEKTPFERLRVIDKISVSELMGLINKEQLYKKLARIEKRYTVHRWIRKINKEGLAACLKNLSSEWFNSLEKIFKKSYYRR